MDRGSIDEVWSALEGERLEVIDAFYERLFERFPGYRELFSVAPGMPSEKMVDMFNSVAGFADHTGLIRPHIAHAGAVHRGLGITAADVENFKEVFLATLAETYPGTWEPRHEAAWRQAFEQLIVPSFDEGLRRPSETD